MVNSCTLDHNLDSEPEQAQLYRLERLLVCDHVSRSKIEEVCLKTGRYCRNTADWCEAGECGNPPSVCRHSLPPLSSQTKSFLFLIVWGCFQILVVCLVILDAIFVLVELLLDLSIIKLEHGNVAPEVRHRFVRSPRTTSAFYLAT